MNNKIEQLGKAWKHPVTGEIRYYVDITDDILGRYGGLRIERYNTGNIAVSYLNGEKISHAEARRIIGDVQKCWLTEDGRVHFKTADRDGLNYPTFWNALAENIEKEVQGTLEEANA